MSEQSTSKPAPVDASLSGAIQQYYDLTKPRVVMLIVFTAFVGMLLAVPGMPDWKTVVLACVGIWLAAASGAAMNQIIDMRADAIMARTQNRPLATGGLQVWQAVVFALLLCGLGMLVLVLWVNVLTAVLTFISMVGYGIIYTVFLKPATPQNIVIGGAAGAAPPLLGWVAMTNAITPEGCLLFLIIFAWTPPHFWALALYRREEYAAAGVPMLPVTHGEEFTRLQILLYTYILVAVTLLPFTIHMFGALYLAAAVYLNARFMYYVYTLYRNYSDALSRKTFFYSIKYLMYLFAAMLVDHYFWDRIVLWTLGQV
ncbi:protoheme IX farnesyltransferase [Arenicella chitinivorans]|uniref:Protoheme IX farnesyltransferase n=1 Tax=Arenicella chitinivorans TaxID=1329800 RepID=A0A918RR95_9GAMM|nr:heme o synthase [Arenicella chitinivorans]GHA06184.1 protoheme IX farnesyltransferase [Arenicella chitinivorans]